MSAAAPLLSVRELSVSFGGLQALQGVSLHVGRQEIVGLIGPNGAGKTTLFNTLTRLYTPDRGEVHFDGQDVLRWARHEVIAHGLARTFQNLLLCNHLSALENVMLGVHARTRAGFLACAFRLPSARREERAARRWCEEVLELVGLDAVAAQPAGSLPFGHQRLLELARALASRPTLLLLDEPGAGLNAQELDALMRVIRRIREQENVTTFLIGHTMHLVLGISDRVVVLDHGVKIADGSPHDIRRNADVVGAYLGKPDSGAVTA